MANKIVIAASNLKFDIDEINDCLYSWKNDKTLYLPEDYLNHLFTCNHVCVSKDTETEFAKICALNSIYGTRMSLKEMVSMTNYLCECSQEISNLIENGNPAAVSNITNAIKNEGYRCCYSFATKYCSFAAPDTMKDSYPIYDSNIASVYKVWWKKWNPNNDKRFHKYDFDPWETDKRFIWRNENKYILFKAATDMMRNQLSHVRELTVKELDQYLWKTVKDNLEKIK